MINIKTKCKLNVTSGMRVQHKKFGLGTIDVVYNGKIRVIFDKLQMIKEFHYPNCFNHSLSIVDTDVSQASIANDVKDPIYEAEEEQQNTEMACRILDHNKNSCGGRYENFNPYGSFEAFREESVEMLENEIDYLKHHTGTVHGLFDGELIGHNCDSWEYSFESDEELRLPEGIEIKIYIKISTDTNNKITVASKKINGTIIDCNEMIVRLRSSLFLGEKVPEIGITSDSWRLLEFLKKRYEDYYYPSDISRQMIENCRNAIHSGNQRHFGQEEAIKMSEEQPITFIWGPPGTGKTETLARIAIHHLQKGSRVLMLSYSNKAVDEGFDRTVIRYKEHSDRYFEEENFLRYGYVQDDFNTDHYYLSDHQQLIRKYPKLWEQHKELLNTKENINKIDPKCNSTECKTINHELDLNNKKIRKATIELLSQAAFVATTVTKAVIDPHIYDGDFDLVIFDEASMAYLQQLVFSAAIARERFVCIGDFNQLPPIVQNSGNSRLKCDAFVYCGIQQAVTEGKSHDWLCMLDTQYRMHPDIAEFVSENMYDGLLKSHKDVKKKVEGITDLKPFPGQSMHLVDLTGSYDLSLNMNGSHYNIMSALISMLMAVEYARYSDVGIITPYRAQARLLRAMAIDIHDADKGKELNDIMASTVHQFQGSEEDVIVYDVADCYIQPALGGLLTSFNNNQANRLFNVAMTRARGKFIAVTDLNYVKLKLHGNKNKDHLLFQRLLDNNIDNHCTSSVAPLCEPKTIGPCMSILDLHQAEELYLQDIQNAKKNIDVFIPADIIHEETFMEALGSLLVEKSKDIQICIFCAQEDILPCFGRILVKSTGYPMNPITVIDEQISWLNVPLCRTGFKLRCGKPVTIAYRPIMRFEGRRTARHIRTMNR